MFENDIEFNQAAFKHGISEADIRHAVRYFVYEEQIEGLMARMTEEEADALDELWTKSTPALKHGAGGFFTRQRELLASLDKVTAEYISSQAEALHQSPAEVIAAMVRKELAATA